MTKALRPAYTEGFRGPAKPRVSGWRPRPPGGGIKLPVEGLVRADPADFDRLVAAHRERVTRLAYRLLGWSVEVEDVVQEVFLAALKGLSSFRGEADIATWLTRITINKCRTHRRRQWLWARFTRSVREPELARAADQRTIDRDTAIQVRRAVQQLPARYREAVVLRYLEEMPSAQIAEMLGLSQNSIEVRLHRARARLKILLADLVKE